MNWLYPTTMSVQEKKEMTAEKDMEQQLIAIGAEKKEVFFFFNLPLGYRRWKKEVTFRPTHAMGLLPVADTY